MFCPNWKSSSNENDDAFNKNTLMPLPVSK